MDLVDAPGGVVDLWDARRRTHRRVRLVPFRIATTPVTVGQYSAVRDSSCAPTAGDLPVAGVTWTDAVTWCNLASHAAGLEPAYRLQPEGVSWNPESPGYRLPTEAEWVHASRGMTSGPRHGPLAEIAWSAADGGSGPHPVALKTPNSLGLYDTIGNVWEWCWDHLDPARYGDYRVFKGGAWADPEWSCRVGVRRGNAPDAVVEDVGFRVARGAVHPPDDSDCVQGWSAAADRLRASVSGPLPVGWTPLGTR